MDSKYSEIGKCDNNVVQLVTDHLIGKFLNSLPHNPNF